MNFMYGNLKKNIYDFRCVVKPVKMLKLSKYAQNIFFFVF